MDISRILSIRLSPDRDDHLSRSAASFKNCRAPGSPEATGCDYYPRIHLSSTPEREAGYLSPLFVLHRMGFFLRSGLRRNPVGSYPAFSPLPSTFFTTLNKVNVAIMKEVLGGLFSVTLSVTRGFRLGCPRFHGAYRLLVFGLSSTPKIFEAAIVPPHNNIPLKCVSATPRRAVTCVVHARGADESAPYRQRASTLRKTANDPTCYPNCSRICFARIMSDAFRTSRIGCSGSATLP